MQTTKTRPPGVSSATALWAIEVQVIVDWVKSRVILLESTVHANWRSAQEALRNPFVLNDVCRERPLRIIGYQ